MPSFPSNIEFYALIGLAMVFGALASIIPLFITCFGFLQRFATKDELKAVAELAESRGKEAASQLQSLEGRLTREIGDNRGNNEHRFGQIASKLDNLQQAVQLFANETSRATGAMEGKTAMMEKLIEKQMEAKPQ